MNETDRVKDFTPDKAINNFFEDFIKRGQIVEEKEVLPGMNIKLRALNTEESLNAESIIRESKLPADIVAKVRAASILSQALISINGMPIVDENDSDDIQRIKRMHMYNNLMKTAPVAVEKMYALYVQAVNKQVEIHNSPSIMMEECENFSQHHSEN
ncbi:MAG: hypothetical protein RR420_00740 [Anaerovoracaceae bacterium]